MEVVEIEDREQPGWDAFVHRAPDATFMHLYGWRYVLRDTNNNVTYYLCARHQGRIVGVLPLIYINSILAGHYLGSLPGGVSATGEEAALALIDKAKEITREKQAQYLVLRDSLQKWEPAGLTATAEHCTAIWPLSPGQETVWREIKSSKRRQVKKASKNGLVIKEGINYLPALYPPYSQAIQKKGTPTYGLRFFQNLARNFPENFKVMVIEYAGKVIGGTFMARFNDTLVYLWPGVPRDYYALQAYPLLYWEMAQYGLTHGCSKLDLGRSPCGSGALKFKSDWGTETKQLYQLYYLHKVSKPPPVGHSMAQKPHYRLFFQIWQRLPYRLTEWIGPHLTRRMPFS